MTQQGDDHKLQLSRLAKKAKSLVLFNSVRSLKVHLGHRGHLYPLTF